MKNILLIALLLCTTTLFTQAQDATYTVDGAHSSLVFAVGYKFSDFHGSFGDIAGKVALKDEKDFSTAAVDFTVQIASINTNSETRDGHLQGERYFNAEKAATATFKSNYIKPTGHNTYEMTGDLSIAGTTLSQTVTVVIKGQGEVEGKDGKKSSIMGAEATFDFNRSNFGIKGGLPTIADNVKVTVALTLVKE
ncbi:MULTISPECIES: YceI family protein [unclassified Aureispira]|uniref:YceI family protein n=1 Tax=unclassified Aureispira TaxID=2649989 RepID=UPI000696B38F|nr:MULTISPECIES: YceI family protein [unclassified Aureispira]WMX17312.1 YceI family protein [Aureispira sp. CCB-E]